MTDIPILLVSGIQYVGWTSLRVSRAIDRMASDFHLQLTQRWAGKTLPRVREFDAAQILFGDDVMLTGYVDSVQVSGDANSHTVAISGRSKTEDVIDCTPDIPGGTYAGYRLDAIARDIAGRFGIDVVVQADVGEAFPEVAIERHETGFAFLERLSRLRGVLLSDDEHGRLLLTRAGAERASGRIKLGENVQGYSVELSSSKRFSEYRVKTQAGAVFGLNLRPITAPEPPDRDHGTSVADQQAAAAAYADEHEPLQTQANTVTSGIAYDYGVPRFRPHTIIAESALDAPGAQARASWQARYNAARSQSLHVDLAGWRQADGAVWRHNRIVPVEIQGAEIEQDLLIATVSWELSAAGRMTRMTLGPIDGYTPDPGQVKARKGRGGGPLGALDIKPIPR